MSLQFIIGNSGAGKSGTAYEKYHPGSVSMNPDRLYYVIVPEQFTMQTQKTLVEMHPDGGILNIDILSFERLAYRVFEEVGGDTTTDHGRNRQKHGAPETGTDEPEGSGLSAEIR